MRRRWIAAGLLVLGAGCNRQDAEGLGRIGTLVAQRLEKLKPGSVPAAESNAGRPQPGYPESDSKPDVDAQK